jgi:serine/threonine protein kinase
VSEGDRTLAELEALFHRVVDLAPDERERLLGPLRRDHPQLCDGVERLLGREDRAREAGALSAAGPLVADALDGAEPGIPAALGPYRLLRHLGAGGMGVVYEAEQSEPIARRVAIKVVSALGRGSERAIARFDAERRVLALMQHPNIATVLDAGTTDDGRPFFVMERVEGEPITGYCDRGRLDVPARLRLFADVCDAVQHAHQKGSSTATSSPRTCSWQNTTASRSPK